MEDLDQLFNEAVTRVAKPEVGNYTPYGRGKDYNLTAVLADIQRGFRICTKCRESKTLDNFSKRSAHVTGYKAWCKSCDSIAFNAHRRANLAKHQARERAQHYERKYNLDKDLAKVLSNPNNRIGTCPLCRNVEHLVLDHDHKTGKVRDLICSQCNTMLGNARDSLDVLYEAIAYLKKHKGV